MGRIGADFMVREASWRAVRPPGHGSAVPGIERPTLVGGHGRGGTPGPIPNPEVKPPSADGTAGQARGRAGRRRPATGIRQEGEVPGGLPLLAFPGPRPARGGGCVGLVEGRRRAPEALTDAYS